MLITSRKLWLLYAISAITFLFALWYPYIGEEGTYTISAIEMWWQHNFLITTFYGLPYGRPPLMNWLIIPIASLIGWGKMLLATRTLTLIATTLTGLVLAWLVKNLSKNKLLAAFCAVIFLSGDTLFYRGWLAYADPLFTLFVFSALASLWVGLHTERTHLLWNAVFLITCAALTKVETAYVFYLVTLSILLFNTKYRKTALSLSSILAHIFGVSLFVGWYYLATNGMQNTAVDSILQKMHSISPSQYLNQLVTFPLETWARFLPASGVAVYLWLRKQIKFTNKVDPWLPYGIAIFFGNYLPYWLGPETSIRYIMPIYPLLAFIIGYYLYHADGISLTTKWLIAALVLKCFFALLAFPWYQNHFRGNYDAVATDVVQKTANFPLYVNDLSATGIAVTSSIDAFIYPKKPLTMPPSSWKTGFVLHYSNDPNLGRVIHRYQLGGSEIYLLCRGKACRI